MTAARAAVHTPSNSTSAGTLDKKQHIACTCDYAACFWLTHSFQALFSLSWSCLTRTLLIFTHCSKLAAFPERHLAAIAFVLCVIAGVVQPEDRCAGSCYCAVDSNIIRAVVHHPDFPRQILSNNVTVEACDYYLFSSLTSKQIVSIPVLMVSNDASCGINPPRCSGQDTSGPHAVAASGPAQGK